MSVKVTLGKSIFDKQLQIDELEDEKEHLRNRVKELLKENTNKEDLNRDKDRQINSLKMQLERQETRCEANEIVVEDMVKNNRDLGYRIKALEMQIKQTEKGFQQLHQENEALKHEKALFLENNFMLTNNNQSLRETNSKVVNKLDKEVKHLKTLNEEIDQLNQSIRKKDEFIAALIKERNKLKNKEGKKEVTCLCQDKQSNKQTAKKKQKDKKIRYVTRG